MCLCVCVFMCVCIDARNKRDVTDVTYLQSPFGTRQDITIPKYLLAASSRGSLHLGVSTIQTILVDIALKW